MDVFGLDMKVWPSLPNKVMDLHVYLNTKNTSAIKEPRLESCFSFRKEIGGRRVALCLRR